MKKEIKTESLIKRGINKGYIRREYTDGSVEMVITPKRAQEIEASKRWHKGGKGRRVRPETWI